VTRTRLGAAWADALDVRGATPEPDINITLKSTDDE
jgi:hypothetical protein